MQLQRILSTGLIVGLFTVGGCASTAPGHVSDDGLVKQADTKFDELYMRPGASLDSFAGYGLEPCEVSFRKNWVRDQNHQRPDISNRITQRNVDKIKESMGGQCNKYLQEALAEQPPYALTHADDVSATNERLLVIRPKIIDLDIHAPDTDGPGIQRDFTRSFGEMTLVLELTDAATGEVLARAIDKRRGPDHGQLKRTNSITNKFESDRILRRWSKMVREGLDSSLGATTGNS